MIVIRELCKNDVNVELAKKNHVNTFIFRKGNSYK